jgi:hypothetical protein
MRQQLLCLIIVFFYLPVYASGDTTGRSQLLFRGAEYTKIVANSSGTPYMYEDTPGIRKVHYFGHWFSGVELHYDAEDDLLMTREVNGAIRMSLVKEKVSSFYLGSRKFVVVNDIGFCEVLYEGPHAVLVRWQKVLVRRGVEDPYYRTYERVFVSDKGTLVEVSGKKGLMELAGKKTKKMQDPSKQLKLDYKKNFPMAAAQFMAYVDQHQLYE